MGREVRRVPAGWQHPTEGEHRDGSVRYVPMHDEPHAEALREYLEVDLPEWLAGERLWRVEGKVKAHDGIQTIAERVAATEGSRRPKGTPTYEWWAGKIPSPPDPANYMPDWPEESRTHYMMYETCSEGTPISPAFATPEEVARWCADNGASAFGAETASYEAWLRIARGGYACSAVIENGVLRSGVEALKDSP